MAKARYTGLSLTFLFVFFSSYSQALVPELVFMNATLKTGSGCKVAGADGAVYIFQNVTTDVDAIVTIKGRSDANVSLSDIDLTGPDQDPAKGTGYDNAWQPRVAYNGGNAPANCSWWMEFEISFVQHDDNTVPVSVNTFYVTGLDVDGDGKNLHEYLSFYQPQAYILEQNTDIQPSSVVGCLSNLNIAGKEFDGPTKNYPNITPTATDVMVTNYFTNTNRFVVRIGAKTGSTSTNAANRMNSLWFKTFTFNVPVTNTLPLSLLAFTAQLNNDDVMLRWSTQMQSNTSHFTIQRSVDGTSFDDDGVVFTDGNSDVKQNYSFNDNISGLPSAQLIYYRLKMVDMDQRFGYSPVVVVRLGDDQSQTSVSIFPNPAFNELRITIPSAWQNKTIAYTIYSTNGMLMKQKTSENAGQTESLFVDDLPAGIYFVRATNGNQTAVRKLLKHN